MISTWHARTTRTAVDQKRDLALRIAGLVPAGGSVLEVAPGPGYLLVELARLGTSRCSGLDTSRILVETERRNAAEAGVQVDFRIGDATSIPFADASFDLVVCMAALGSFLQPRRVLEEFHRVLRRGGTVLMMDHRRVLLGSAHAAARIQALAAGTSFGGCQIRRDNMGMEITLRKRAPGASVA